MSRNVAIMNQPSPTLLRGGRSRWMSPATAQTPRSAGRSVFLFCAVGLALGLLGACAPGPNELAHTTSGHGAVAGFWLGLWHGMIVCVTFIVSLFSKNVHLCEVHNNGAWYNAGFMLGACMSLGGSSHGASRRSKKQVCRSEAGPRPEAGK